MSPDTLFPERLSRHLQRLGLGPVQAARQIGCSTDAVRDAVVGGGVATDQLVLLYAWVRAEDRLHPQAAADEGSPSEPYAGTSPRQVMRVESELGKAE